MARLVEAPVVMTGQAWSDYGLIDSGDGRKLERYGPELLALLQSTANSADQ